MRLFTAVGDVPRKRLARHSQASGMLGGHARQGSADAHFFLSLFHAGPPALRALSLTAANSSCPSASRRMRAARSGRNSGLGRPCATTGLALPLPRRARRQPARVAAAEARAPRCLIGAATSASSHLKTHPRVAGWRPSPRVSGLIAAPHWPRGRR